MSDVRDHPETLALQLGAPTPTVGALAGAVTTNCAIGLWAPNHVAVASRLSARSYLCTKRLLRPITPRCC
jgi:hypothetical protein